MSMNFEDIEAFNFTNKDILEKHTGLLCRTTSKNCFCLDRTNVGITGFSLIIFGGTNLNPRYPNETMITIGAVEKQLLRKEVCKEWILGRTLIDNQYYMFPAEDIILEK